MMVPVESRIAPAAGGVLKPLFFIPIRDLISGEKIACAVPANKTLIINQMINCLFIFNVNHGVSGGP